jgi:hypothetical protein
MNDGRVRRRIWKILGILLAVGLVLLGSMASWIRSIADRKEARLKEQVHQLHAETLARVDARPALYGETVPGNAWPGYSAALDEARKMRTVENLIRDVWGDSPKADRTQAEQVVALHGVLFDHLREGARRDSGALPLTWEEGWSLKTPNLYDAELLARFVTIAARTQAQRGNPAEAVLKILDLLQFARDLAANSTSKCAERSSILWSIATLELQELAFSNEYPRSDLSGLDEALERLDHHLPASGPILLNETLRVGFELLKSEARRDEEFLLGFREYWRYGCSRRIADTDGFDRLLTYARKDAPLQDGPLAELRAIRAELILPYHPLYDRANSAGIYRWMGGMRGQRTTLRLLRVAVHYRATGEILDLGDPYGDKLHHSIIGSDLRVWSVGPDGIDHGGDIGDYDWSRRRPTPVPGQPFKPWRVSRDLVLQVER